MKSNLSNSKPIFFPKMRIFLRRTKKICFYKRLRTTQSPLAYQYDILNTVWEPLSLYDLTCLSVSLRTHEGFIPLSRHFWYRQNLQLRQLFESILHLPKAEQEKVLYDSFWRFVEMNKKIVRLLFCSRSSKISIPMMTKVVWGLRLNSVSNLQTID